MKWTSDQSRVLESVSNNLLVAASAGSGKTATMIEKILRQIKSGTELKDIVAITFTDAAATEMKIKLKDALSNEEQTESIRNALDYLPQSDISTLHSFCAKMLRKYFYFLDIKPNFAVLDDNNSKFLKANAMQKTLRDYSKNTTDEFMQLQTAIGGGRNFDELISLVNKFHAFLQSVDDKKGFASKIAFSCYEQDLNKNIGVNYLVEYISKNAKFLYNDIRELKLVAEQQGADFFVTFLGSVESELSGVASAKTLDDMLFQLNNLVLPRLTNRKYTDSELEFKKNDFSSSWGTLKKRINNMRDFMPADNTQTLKNDLATARVMLKTLCEVEAKFEEYYNELKASRNALDFDDLEEKFLQLVENKEVQTALNFKYVCVDEYQDINFVQEKIIGRITANCKLLMVGDVKQSIYGFRNTTPDIFVGKAQNYAENEKLGELIRLNQNFRSNPIILSYVNSIFERCMSIDFGGVDYKNSAKLVGSIKYPKTDTRVVEINVIEGGETHDDDFEYGDVYSVFEDKNRYDLVLTDSRKEGLFVAQKIKELLGKDIYNAKTEKMEKMDFSHFAVICRENKHLKEVAETLIDCKIPVSTKIDETLTSMPDVMCVLDLLKLINNYHDDESLAVVLTSVFGGFTFDDLVQIRGFAVTDTLYESVKLVCDSKTPLGDRAKTFLDNLSNLREEIKYRSIYEILCAEIERVDYYNRILSLPDGFNRVKLVENYVSSFNGADYNYNLADYLDYVKTYGIDGKATTTIGGNENAVTLINIHKSKGLEYPVVFFVGGGKTFSNQLFMEKVIFDKDFGMGICSFDVKNRTKRENVARGAIKLHKLRQEREELLRLLYVALTRAKNHLYIVGCAELTKFKRFYSTDDARSATCFLDWILNALSDINFKNFITNKKQTTQKLDCGTAIYNVISSEDIVDNFTCGVKRPFDFEKLGDVAPLCFDEVEKSTIALKNSVSALLKTASDEGENFVESPKKLNVFEYETTLDASGIGTLYHAVMEKVNFEKPFDEKIYENILQTLNLTDEQRSVLNYDDFKTCVDSIKSLGKIGDVKKELAFISYLPYNEIFGGKVSDKVLIQGVADLVLEVDSKYILVDYKTNNVKSADQLVGKYKVQLDLYRICLGKSLHLAFDEVLIYSFKLKKFVKIF